MFGYEVRVAHRHRDRSVAKDRLKGGKITGRHQEHGSEPVTEIMAAPRDA